MKQAAFDSAFAGMQGELESYLLRLTTNREQAADLAQDTFVRARRALSSYRGGSTIKTWVFAIATNLARDHFRVRQRWRDDIQDRCRASTKAAPARVDRMLAIVEASPAERYEFKEHIDYCFTCISKTLRLEQQVVLLLKDVYGFTVDEVVEVVGSTRGRVKHALADARSAMNEVFDRRCVLVSKKGVCHQCSEIQGFVNPKRDARAAALELELVRAAENGDDAGRLLELRTELVRSVDPLHSPGSELHSYLLSLMEEHA